MNYIFILFLPMLVYCIYNLFKYIINTYLKRIDKLINLKKPNFKIYNKNSVLQKLIIFCENPQFYNSVNKKFYRHLLNYILETPEGRIVRCVARNFLKKNSLYIPVFTYIFEIFLSYQIELCLDRSKIFNYYIQIAHFNSRIFGFSNMSIIKLNKSIENINKNEILYLLSELKYPSYLKISFYSILYSLNIKKFLLLTKNYKYLIKWKNKYLFKLTKSIKIESENLLNYQFNNVEVLCFFLYYQKRKSKILNIIKFEEILKSLNFSRYHHNF